MTFIMATTCTTFSFRQTTTYYSFLSHREVTDNSWDGGTGCERMRRVWGGSTYVRLTGFPGSYSWVSGNLLASGWSQTPPNSPLSPCPGLLHQLPEKEQKEFINKMSGKRKLKPFNRANKKSKMRTRGNVKMSRKTGVG